MVEKYQEDKTSAVYEQVALAIKSNTMCTKPRKDFAMCRATMIGRKDDPSFCDTQAAALIQCHN